MTRRVLALAVVAALAGGLGGCAGGPKPGDRTAGTSASAVSTATPLPDSTYYLRPGLPAWVDPTTGVETTRTWRLEGGTWPVTLVMSPSQSPQLLAGWEDGRYRKHLQAVGVAPVLTRIDGAERTFHALERSQWPFVYMPLTAFVEYCSSPENRGGAGGLQYIAIAGSTAGGGYTLVARDPAVRAVADLGGKRVAMEPDDAVAGAVLTRSVESAGLKVGDGPGEVRVAVRPAVDQWEGLTNGGYDALVVPRVGSRPLSPAVYKVADFADGGYLLDVTILCVERTVLEKRPEVVEAFLQAHWESQRTAEGEWRTRGLGMLQSSWNGFYSGQRPGYGTATVLPDLALYKEMLGDVRPEVRLDRTLIEDCVAFEATQGRAGWSGSVDPSRLVDREVFNRVLSANGAGVRQ